MNNYEHIEELIQTFFDGKTSNKEEMELYSFFSGDNIPEHLQSYIAVFQYFDTGIEKEFNNNESKKELKKPTPKIRHWSTWVGIAASFLLLVTVFSKIVQNNNDSFDPYEGSYIIRNGVIITDMDVIRPELEATIAAVNRQQESIEKMINMSYQIEDYDQIEKRIENEYCELINSFPDENARKIVQEILNVECY